MTAPNKDTIYIDIDDEITSIIDKLKGSESKVVALVLPKRAAVFQSIVNMKLLKRAADGSKKNLVLITSEAGLLPLAGAAGVHVAKTLTSKPEIPLAPNQVDDDEETIDETGEPGEEPVDASQPVGALAGAKPAGDEVETLVLDDDELPPELDDKAGPKKKDFTPPKKNKKLKIPDFNRFRLLLILGGLLLILLVGGLILGSTTLSKATITIKTDSTAIDTNVDIGLSTAATKVSTSDNTIPAKLASLPKTYTQQVPTTGQKNNGNKASGDVTVTNCSRSDDPVNIPAGTGFSSGGNTYISQESVTVPQSKFTGSNRCAGDTGKADVSVLAQSGGAAFNKPAGASFTIAGGASGLSASGDTIAGGTDSIVQTVNQNDLNNAKAKIAANDDEAKKALTNQLKKENYFVVTATFAPGTPNTTSSSNVGDVANNVTVTETITYTMFGVKRVDLEKLIEENIGDQIDTGKQAIIDNGLDKANFNVDNMSATTAQLALSTRATVGPDIDIDSLREEVAGQKPGPVKDDLKTNPDVTDVQVKLSPFWASSIPKNPKKITIDIAKPTKTTQAGNSSADNP